MRMKADYHLMTCYHNVFNTSSWCVWRRIREQLRALVEWILSLLQYPVGVFSSAFSGTLLRINIDNTHLFCGANDAGLLMMIVIFAATIPLKWNRTLSLLARWSWLVSSNGADQDKQDSWWSSANSHDGILEIVPTPVVFVYILLPSEEKVSLQPYHVLW